MRGFSRGGTPVSKFKVRLAFAGRSNPHGLYLNLTFLPPGRSFSYQAISPPSLLIFILPLVQFK